MFDQHCSRRVEEAKETKFFGKVKDPLYEISNCRLHRLHRLHREKSFFILGI